MIINQSETQDTLIMLHVCQSCVSKPLRNNVFILVTQYCCQLASTCKRFCRCIYELFLDSQRSYACSFKEFN